MNNVSPEETLLIICPTCSSSFKRRKAQEESHPLYFCAYCGSKLRTDTREDKVEKKELNVKATIVREHLPKKEEIQSTIGQYQIIRQIGKGGMGEVYLAYDTVCGRKIALKRIRRDLVDFPQIQKRFLHEARITSQLIHPAIIPIYSIDCEEGFIYYSMPYAEGSTLKLVLRRAFDHEYKHKNKKDLQGSIPYLIRHFLQVCQAIAYAHSKHVLHRDIKPENIIVGTYGQIHILDWGLAKAIDAPEEKEMPELTATKETERITRLGKVVGTIAFMAPERALGNPATIQTDIYSLGVILYQILTLQLPFRRKSLASFIKNWQKEQLIPPEVMAPYRDVPQVLAETVKKCLHSNPSDRYQSVDALIHSLENYLEGRSEWLLVEKLDINNKNDWKFQENILLAEHTAITRAPEISDWVSLMISKKDFVGNSKVEASVTIGATGQGIGLIFCVPEDNDPRRACDGYTLWLASEKAKNQSTKLLISSVSVLEAPEIILKTGVTYHIRLEKIEDHIYFYLNNVLQFSYTSHIPVIGTHIGLLSHDADFEWENCTVSIGSQNIYVSCLAVPDALLARKLYSDALAEYRRIGTVFPGRQEGREALFRAGITLLEEAKSSQRTSALEKALEEFGKLRPTPGAPLEYLGKAFVYKEMQEYEEEAKCFELALRRYKNHPLLPVIEEQIVFRMHEGSRQNRIAAYYFICLVARFIPSWAERPTSVTLFESLQKNWEIPAFMLHAKDAKDAELKRLNLCLGVAFWLAKPYVIAEAIDDILQRPIVAIGQLSDGIFLLVELGAHDLAREKMRRIREVLSETEQKRFADTLTLLDYLIESKFVVEFSTITPEHAITPEPALTPEIERYVRYILRKALDSRDTALIQKIVTAIVDKEFIHQELIDALLAEYYLYQEDIAKLHALFAKYPKDRLNQESCHLYFVHGCYILLTQGLQVALKHFAKLLDIAFPRSWVLAAHLLAGKVHMTSSGWFKGSFMWERRTLYQQLALFWHVAQNAEKEMSWYTLVSKEYIYE
jgi:serine/threonine-protein kinase